MAEQNLIIQTAFVGDLLLSIPLIRFLKSTDSVPLKLVCRPGLGNFFKQLGLVDSVYELNKKSRYNSVTEFANVKQLVCVHRSPRSFFLAHRINAKEKIGYEVPLLSHNFDKKIPRPLHRPEVLRQLALVKDEWSRWPWLDHQEQKVQRQIRTTQLVSLPEELSLRTEVPKSLIDRDRQELFRSLGLLTQKVVYLAPGSVWATKRWHLRGFIELTRELTRRGYLVAILGAEAEKKWGEQICAEVPTTVNLIGQTSLLESVWLMQYGQYLICNDSGAMHLGAVAGIPTVAVFGATTLDLGYQPWSNKAVVIEKLLACRPCGLHGGEICPLGTHACMQEISTEHVLKCLELLN